MQRFTTTAAVLLCCSAALVGCGNGATNPNAAGAPTTAATVVSDQVKQLVDSGANKLTQGDIPGAKADFNSALAQDPSNVLSHYNLGVIAQQVSDAKGAIAQYDQALAKDPTYTPAMYNKAILLEPNTPDQAMAIYERIVQINPKASTAFFRLSNMYSAKNRPEDAKAAREKAIALDPTLGQASTPTKTP